jgi:AraC-like DNA-binding protein
LFGRLTAGELSLLTREDNVGNISGHRRDALDVRMPQLIRSAVLNNYVELSRSLGLDPYRMIVAYGLPAACLDDPEIKVPLTSVLRLLEESALQSGKPDFGLRLANNRTLANVGALALLVREQPTIRKALDALASYIFLHSEALVVRIVEEDDLLINFIIETGRPLPMRQAVELGIGFLHRSFQRLFRQRWRPQAVCFSHAPPNRLDAHRRFFGVEVRFNQDFNGMICASHDVDVAVPAADAVMAKQVQQYLNTLASRRTSKLSETVRECIYLMLPSGLCTVDTVAKRMGINRRTLHRHLAREGQTFSSIIDAVRAELATRYIGSRDLASISDLLGFSARSAFSRWFRSQFGCSVSEWRATEPLPPQLNLPGASSLAGLPK